MQLKSAADRISHSITLSALVLDIFAVMYAWWAERGCLKPLLIRLGLEMGWRCMHHRLLVVKPTFDAFNLNAELVDSMLMGRNFFFEICLNVRHVSQSSLVLINKLLFLFKLLLQSLNLGAQTFVPVNNAVCF